MLLLPACSGEDAHKQQQTSLFFFLNQGKLHKRNRVSSACNVSALPRISAILVVLKLSVLHLPDHLVCLLYRRLEG